MNNFDEVPDSGFIKTHYNSWDNIVEESIVRSLDFLPITSQGFFKLAQTKNKVLF
ncbi:MAG: hypothetical protein K0S71_1861 [Clostridia bacterium]|jgi:hypothetical protein|nr:hypothetical protein [Clostridia bacterium]